MRKKIILSITLFFVIVLFDKCVFGSNMLSTINPTSAMNNITMKNLTDYIITWEENNDSDTEWYYFTQTLGFNYKKDDEINKQSLQGLVHSGIVRNTADYSNKGLKWLLTNYCNAESSYGMSSANKIEETELYGVIGTTKEKGATWPSVGGTDIYYREKIYIWRNGNKVFVGCSAMVNNAVGVWSYAHGAIYRKTLDSSATGHCSWYEPTNSAEHYKSDVEKIAKNSAKTGETISNIKVSGSWSTNNDFTKGNKKVIFDVKKSNSKTYKRAIKLEWDNIYDLIWYTQAENDVLYKDENGNKVISEEDAEEEAGKEADKTKKEIYSKLLTSDEGSERTSTKFTDVLSNPDSYKPEEITNKDSDEVITMGSKILSAINVIGIVASVIILAVLGIKYILGSVEEKAELKEDLVPYVIGIVLLTGIPTIVNILYNLGVSFYTSG